MQDRSIRTHCPPVTSRNHCYVDKAIDVGSYLSPIPPCIMEDHSFVRLLIITDNPAVSGRDHCYTVEGSGSQDGYQCPPTLPVVQDYSITSVVASYRPSIDRGVHRHTGK